MGIKQKIYMYLISTKKTYLRSTQWLFVSMYLANPTQCAISVIEVLTTKKVI
jgi:hypothetical protein